MFHIRKYPKDRGESKNCASPLREDDLGRPVRLRAPGNAAIPGQRRLSGIGAPPGGHAQGWSTWRRWGDDANYHPPVPDRAVRSAVAAPPQTSAPPGAAKPVPAMRPFAEAVRLTRWAMASCEMGYILLPQGTAACGSTKSTLMSAKRSTLPPYRPRQILGESVGLFAQSCRWSVPRSRGACCPAQKAVLASIQWPWGWSSRPCPCPARRHRPRHCTCSPASRCGTVPPCRRRTGFVLAHEMHLRLGAGVVGQQHAVEFANWWSGQSRPAPGAPLLRPAGATGQ